MASITLYAAGATPHTIAAAGSTEWPSVGATINRRSFADLTNRTRARINLGNSTTGFRTAELFVQYTTDLTGATGWTSLGVYDDGASGPLINVSQQNYTGPWCTIAAGARQLVALRVMGRLGNDVDVYNTSTLRIGVEGDPLYAGMSLDGGTQGPGIIMFGGSQIAGGGTVGTDPGEFGTLDPALVDVPAGCTLVRNGVTLTEHDDGQHGAEAGVLASVKDAGRTADLVCRYVDATVAADWTDTHLATLATDVTTAGITPRLALYMQGGSDGDSDTTVGAYDFQLRRLIGRLEALWPGIAFIAAPIGSQDLVEHPKLVEARIPFKRRMAEPANGRRAWVTEVGIELQDDDRHPTSAGEVELGRRLVAPWIASGKL